jgi:hypothetical protein
MPAVWSPNDKIRPRRDRNAPPGEQYPLVFTNCGIDPANVWGAVCFADMEYVSFYLQNDYGRRGMPLNRDWIEARCRLSQFGMLFEKDGVLGGYSRSDHFQALFPDDFLTRTT